MQLPNKIHLVGEVEALSFVTKVVGFDVVGNEANLVVSTDKPLSVEQTGQLLEVVNRNLPLGYKINLKFIHGYFRELLYKASRVTGSK